jgi:histidinol phosphatase-like PHP family hydrolase
MARIDLHTHSILSDGVLLPEELARRLEVFGLASFALTDHAGPSNLRDIVEKTREASRYVSQSFSIRMLAGVELTHVHPKDIPGLAREARRRGAQIVVVHGETLVEPTREGTNMAACSCADVDILAHPGMLGKAEVAEARRNGVFIELTSRQGHCLGNGLVARLCPPDMLLLNSDTHAPSDFVSEAFALRCAAAAGLPEEDVSVVVRENPARLLKKRG